MGIRISTASELFKLRTENGKIVNRTELCHNPEPLRLIAARNDCAAFQIILETDEPCVLNVGADPWFSFNGAVDQYRLEAQSSGGLSIRLNPIAPMHENDSTEFADILLRSDAVDIPAGTPSAVYVEAFAAKETRPGVYPCRIEIYKSRMFSAEEKVAEIPFDIEIKSYVLPDPAEWTHWLDLWQHSSNIARKAEVPLWSDRHFQILDDYVETLAELGQKAITVIASEIPWSGQSCFLEKKDRANLYEYSMARVFRDKSGEFRYDFSAIKKYVELCLSKGGFGEIEVFGLINIWQNPEHGYGRPAADYPDAIRVRYRNFDGRYAYMDKAAQIDDYLRALEKFFIDEQLIDMVRVAADEPADKEAFRNSLEHVKAVAPAFRYKAAINHAGFVEEFGADISDFVPGMSCQCNEYDAIRRYLEQADGRRFLWYVCCGPETPNTFLRSELYEAETIGYLTALWGLDGFLRWNYTVWPERPREDIRYSLFPAGDLNFVYPAGDMGVLKTLRWKALRRGIVAFELLRELKKRGLTAAAESATRKILRETDPRLYFNDDGTYKLPPEKIFSHNSEDYLEARKIMLDALS